jgi:hypothetical protein
VARDGLHGSGGYKQGSSITNGSYPDLSGIEFTRHCHRRTLVSGLREAQVSITGSHGQT